VSAREGLLALAARIEALTGPDRETDGFIHASQGYIVDHDYIDMHSPEETPLYTASLDATMTLVLDAHISGVLYHALQCIQQTGFSNSTFLHRLICEIIASALRARAATVPA
jgi:hypothetical protein